MLVVWPVLLALRKTRLWLPWLTAASYFFYGWWNPYYLMLVLYSTLLDFSLVALMDHCPPAGQKVNVLARVTRLQFEDRLLRLAFLVTDAAALGTLIFSAIGTMTSLTTITRLV